MVRGVGWFTRIAPTRLTDTTEFIWRLCRLLNGRIIPAVASAGMTDASPFKPTGVSTAERFVRAKRLKLLKILPAMTMSRTR
jgi:hypothetical protein